MYSDQIDETGQYRTGFFSTCMKICVSTVSRGFNVISFLNADFSTAVPANKAKIDKDAIYGSVIGVLVFLMIVFLIYLVFRRLKRKYFNLTLHITFLFWHAAFRRVQNSVREI